MRDQPHSTPRAAKPVWRTAIDQPLMGAPAVARIGRTTVAAFGFGGRSASSGGLLVLDADTGEALRRIDVGAGVEGGAMMSGTRAIFGDQQGHLHAYDLKDGRKLWEAALEGAIIAAPLAGGGRLAIGTGVGVVAWLDEADGRIIGSARIQSELVASQPMHVLQEPSPSNDYLTHLRHKIVEAFSLDEIRTMCMDLKVDYEELGSETKTGKSRELVLFLARRGRLDALIAWCEHERPNEHWRAALPPAPEHPARVAPARLGARIAGSPAALPSGDVVVGALDGGVYRFDVLRFTLARLFDAGSAVYASPVVTAGPSIAVATQGGEVVAVDQRGDANWRFAAGHAVRNTPALADGALYVGTQGRMLCAIDAARGVELWQMACSNSPTTTPLVERGRVIFGDSRGRVTCVDAGTRRPIWQFDAQADQPGMNGVPAAAFGGLAVHDALVLFGAHNGCAYALEI